MRRTTHSGMLLRRVPVPLARLDVRNGTFGGQPCDGRLSPMGSALLAILRRAGGAARGVATTFEARMERLGHFVRDFIFPGNSSARPFLIMALFAAIVLGIAGGRALLTDGGQPPAAAVVPPASGAATGSAPSLDASSSAPAATPVTTPTVEPSQAPSPTPQSVTLRGPIDVTAMTRTGLKVGTHDVELVVFLDNAQVTGSFTIALDEFPIGSLLTMKFDGNDDPRFATFKTCTVRLVLEGAVTGTHDAKTGKLSGKAAFKSASDDVRDCLKTRPSNLSIDPDSVAEPTTVTWSATFSGTRATGLVDLKPAMPFSATVVD